ncbi:MAG: glucuronyl hydrolase, partial [Bacteroidota bacterium]
YRETGDTVYLEQAKSIADFLLRHPRLPDDLVPYWDYDAPGIPGEPRDASSAAIMASALIELSGFVPREQRGTYLQPAIRMLNTLSSPAYRNRGSQNGPFLLLHSVGSKPQNSEVDVPLTYADYYYLEALIRLKKVLREEKTAGKK